MHKPSPQRSKWRLPLFTAIAAVFLLSVLNGNLQQINRDFFPRSDLNTLFQDAERNQQPLDPDKISEGHEIYYQNIRKSHIVGTLHQEMDHDLIIGFKRYSPDFENEFISILKDHGTVTYDRDVEIDPKQKTFQFFACQYRKNDLIGRELSVTCRPDDEEVLFGYLQTVYRSISGKRRIDIQPLNSSTVTLSTRDGLYFLKEFCVFTASESVKQMPAGNKEYSVLIDGKAEAEFAIP